ncbi:hypothetical protein HIM_10177 [Hirsutella minnesotensis 3608]|uniref:Transcription activator GCR1-like domain-containing protein n=1 Tax=Hirsutella minnesotensis 3608 TaxID=1043627 RepID=A0A0F8A2J6_9HYPO|nr:hypothetical protein HIM_10177 [Hirsutella minnesotensis 3608]
MLATAPESVARPRDNPNKQREEYTREEKGKPPDEAVRMGWGDMPSVDSLERDWGTRWRPSHEKNYFSTCKTIVDEVCRRAQRKDGLAEEVVARQMDEEWGFSSLDKLFTAIRESRRSGWVTLALGDA